MVKGVMSEGMTAAQCMWYAVLPQAVKLMIPRWAVFTSSSRALPSSRSAGSKPTRLARTGPYGRTYWLQYNKEAHEDTAERVKSFLAEHLSLR